MKYNKEITARICDYLQAGNGRIQAAKKAGIHPATLFEWQNKYPEFAEAIKKASEVGDAHVKEVCINTIMKAAVENGAWQAAAWILERRYPGEYGRRVEVKEDKPPAPKPYIIEVTSWQTAETLKKWFDDGTGTNVEIRQGEVKTPLNHLYRPDRDEIETALQLTEIQPASQPASQPESDNKSSLRNDDTTPQPPPPPARPPQQFGTYVLTPGARKTRF